MIQKKSKYQLVDYFFWFFFILMTNPGGIFQAFGEDTSSVGSIDMNDFIFFILLGFYFLVSYKYKIKHKTYTKIIKYLIIFILYYLIVFGYLIPMLKDTPGYTPFQFLKKSRKTIYSVVLFIMAYRFYLRSYVLFYKTLVLSSIIILSLFFITFATGFEILPITTANRGFVAIDRVFIANEGMMLLLIVMGVVILVFKSKLKWNKLILLSASMMFINTVISITRRDIIGTFLYFFIATMLFNYIQHKPIVPVKKLVSVFFYIIIFGFFVSLILPKYSDAVVTGLEESVNVLKSNETSSGKKDVRLGFGKDFMQNLILSNPIFGTGFDNRWRGSGDKQGYETSDYPFLAAIAMTGVVGLTIFLPIYIVLVRILIFDIKFLRKSKVDYESLEFFIYIMFIIYFIYNLLQYVNWFRPLSLSRSSQWYIYLAMYLASREIFYNKVLLSKKSIKQSIN